MIGYNIIPTHLLEKSTNLMIIGIHEFAWDYFASKELIEYLRKNNITILGGDVYLVENSSVETTCDSWYYDPNREEDCYEQSIIYIDKFVIKNGYNFLFSIIFKK